MKNNKKSKSEAEYYRGKYKELVSENKRLRKELARLQHTDHEFEEFKSAFDEYSIVKEEKRKENLCSNCARGKIITISIPGNRTATICKICGHRETKTNDE